MAAGAFEDLRADGGVCSLVANDSRLNRGNMPLGIAADFVGEVDRVALGMNLEAFGPGECDLYRLANEPCHQRRLALNRHVLFATERPAIAYELGLHARSVDAKHAGALALVIEYALTLRINEQSPFTIWRGFKREARRRVTVVLPCHREVHQM